MGKGCGSNSEVIFASLYSVKIESLRNDRFVGKTLKMNNREAILEVSSECPPRSEN